MPNNLQDSRLNAWTLLLGALGIHFNSKVGKSQKSSLNYKVQQN